jgi:hypothetical protein
MTYAPDPTRVTNLDGTPVTTTDVIVDGRLYRLRVEAPNCGSNQHYHGEPHTDGSPSTTSHHHHDERCETYPRQATLFPAWENSGTGRHVHEYAGGLCPCGATRTVLPVPPRPRPGDPAPRRVPVRYRMPADAAHPAGWSYEQPEEPVRETPAERGR